MKTWLTVLALMGAPATAAIQDSGPAPAERLIELQKEKMAVFDWMHGEWRGSAVRFEGVGPLELV
ncbi:hypothetical protein [Sphingomicrobium astaxanthinifaciens]|uniref:hypothetical protein n=1 Tax=Sphingomicrobium astaxanthinifaciens TaxID=1227949 RepID=UPI001FCB0BA5|nr:hypothetical protein [Sphingomicrobium astaxanthinifaciens]MCJ7422098.1 hypothetical protein [Sphingomicrobium astaxanthinifaciens]